MGRPQSDWESESRDDVQKITLTTSGPSAGPHQQRHTRGNGSLSFSDSLYRSANTAAPPPESPFVQEAAGVLPVLYAADRETLQQHRGGKHQLLSNLAECPLPLKDKKRVKDPSSPPCLTSCSLRCDTGP